MIKLLQKLRHEVRYVCKKNNHVPSIGSSFCTKTQHEFSALKKNFAVLADVQNVVMKMIIWWLRIVAGLLVLMFPKV